MALAYGLAVALIIGGLQSDAGGKEKVVGEKVAPEIIKVGDTL